MADVTYPSSTDGDAIVKQYSSITIDAGDTVTIQNRCKGLILYCQGNCTINGTLTMTAKGAGPGAPASPVPANGLRWAWKKDGASDGPFNSPDFPLASLGSAASPLTNPDAFGVAAAIVVQSTKVGGAGGANASGDLPWDNYPTRIGGTITNGTGGGGGAGGYSGGGTGGVGNCWGGGGGGGGAGAGGSGTPGGNGSGTAGGNGGDGPEGGRVGGGGGAGAPAGSGGSDPDGNGHDGETGVGGLLCLFVGGNLTVGPSGVISSNGSAAGDASPPGGGGNAGGGGGSGGGRIIIVHAGTYTNNGSVACGGGALGKGGPNPQGGGGAPEFSGAGGAGAVTTIQVDAAV